MLALFALQGRVLENSDLTRANTDFDSVSSSLSVLPLNFDMVDSILLKEAVGDASTFLEGNMLDDCCS